MVAPPSVSSVAVYVLGDPEAKDSWFPGYLWQGVICGRCNSHLGWYFTVRTLPSRCIWASVPVDCPSVPCRAKGERRKCLLPSLGQI